MLENFDKKYLKSVGLTVLKVLIGLAVLAYFAYQAWHYFSVKVKCESATPFTVTEKSSGEGCIFRNEMPIDCTDSGSLVSSVDTAKRVGIGDEVARIYTASSIDVEKKLSEIEDQLSLLSASLGTDSVTNIDVSRLDSEVYDTVTDMSRSIAGGDFADALACRSSLISTMNRRRVASGATIDFAAQINDLQNKKSTLTGQLGALRSTVYAPSAGWYYPECDGYENIFTFDEIKKLTYERFRELVSEAPRNVSNAGKIVGDCKWYFVCEMSTQSLRTKKIGEEYTFYFPYNRNEKVVMILEKVCEGEGEFGAAVFSSYKMPAGFDYLRMQSYDLMETEYTGFRVPKSAARMVDGQMGVYVLSGEIVRFRKIEVISEYENSYIVAMNHDENTDTAPVTSADTGSSESVPDTAADTDKKTDGGFDAASSPWLEANENIIVSGKGMRDGRIITNTN